MVEFDAQRPTRFADGYRLVQSVEFRAEVVEDVQGSAGGETELGMVAFGFEFGNDDEWDDDVMFGEAQKCAGIREQH